MRCWPSPSLSALPWRRPKLGSHQRRDALKRWVHTATPVCPQRNGSKTCERMPQLCQRACHSPCLCADWSSTKRSVQAFARNLGREDRTRDARWHPTSRRACCPGRRSSARRQCWVWRRLCWPRVLPDLLSICAWTGCFAERLAVELGRIHDLNGEPCSCAGGWRAMDT